ncbi:SRPBCC family protein [Streptomyces sp. NPDC001984]
MAQRLRPVGIDFVETAPVRLVFAREIGAAPDAVYRALAEGTSDWPKWFSALTSARESDGRREIRLRGGARFEETVIVAKAPDVYAYRIDVTNLPGPRAWIEEWRLTPAGTGTRVQMTFALDGAGPFLAAVRLARAGVGGSVRGAIAALDRRLAGKVS